LAAISSCYAVSPSALLFILVARKGDQTASSGRIITNAALFSLAVVSPKQEAPDDWTVGGFSLAELPDQRVHACAFSLAHLAQPIDGVTEAELEVGLLQFGRDTF